MSTGKGSNSVNISQYAADFHMVLCHGPVDNINRIDVDQKLVYLNATPDTSIYIDKPKLYRGDKGEGGIQGYAYIMNGLPTQIPTPYLMQINNNSLNAHRGLLSILLEQMILGFNYYWKPWWFTVTRIHILEHGQAQWHDEIAEVGSSTGLINPIHVIRECITNKTWGLGQDISIINDANFYSAALQCYNEGLGFAWRIDQPTDIKDFIHDIEQHINGTIYLDRTTGLYKINLIRKISNTNSLLTIDKSNIKDISNLKHRQIGDLYNAVQINFEDNDLINIPMQNFVGLLQNPVGAYDNIITVYQQAQNFALGEYYLIDGEAIQVTSISGPNVGVNRGTGYNPPAPHDANSYIFSLDYQETTAGNTFTSTNLNNQITVHNIALAAKQGGDKIKSITYSGVASKTVAALLAARDLKLYSTPLYTGTVVTNRIAENLNPGDAFILDDDRLFDVPTVFRVNTIDLGTLTNNQISLEIIEDVFAIPDIQYYSPPLSNWIPPISSPIPMIYRIVQEIPYYLLAKIKGDTFAQNLDPTLSYVICCGKSPTPDSLDASIYSTVGSTFNSNGTLDFCAVAQLVYSIGPTDTTITITTPDYPAYLTVGTAIQIGSENLGILAISLPTLTVQRGVYDTLPQSHSAESLVFGIENYFSSDQIQYTLTETVKTKLCTNTMQGQLALSVAFEDDIVIKGRPSLPYPPGNLKINSIYWPSVLISGILTLTWSTRNRLQQTNALVDYYSGNITTEPSVVYNGYLKRVDNNAVLDSFTNFSGTTHTLGPSGYIGNVYIILNSQNANGICYYPIIIYLTLISSLNTDYTYNFLFEINPNLLITLASKDYTQTFLNLGNRNGNYFNS